jgi:hypothetical protein
MNRQLTVRMVKDYVDAQLRDIPNRDVLRYLNRYRIRPPHSYWGRFENFKRTKRTYECWAVFEFRRRDIVIGYCFSPYGQAAPWFLNGRGEALNGDWTWCPRFATLEAAFRGSGACPPKWYEDYATHEENRGESPLHEQFIRERWGRIPSR